MLFDKVIEAKPRVWRLPDYDMKSDTPWRGIKALCYEGAPYKGKKTKVFAHIGYPANAVRGKTPAVVLVHGGGGHAFPEWIRLWNELGFAAIAMDTTGFFPSDDKKGAAGTEKPPAEIAGDYTRELSGSLAEDGWTVGPRNSEMKDFDLPVGDQWMYHAVTDTIIAHNILLEDETVDSSKIGIIGVSWGGVVTSIAIGFDDRYAFAVPIYGSGHLDFQPAPSLPAVFREPTVKKTWSAADRFDRVGFPVLWKCFAYDTAFSLGANSLSYLDTKKSGSVFSVSLTMRHSHRRAWASPEGYRFAERIVTGKKPLVSFSDEPQGAEFDLRIDVPDDFSDLSAEIVYLTEAPEYVNNELQNEIRSVPAVIKDGCVKGRAPDGTYCFYVRVAGTAVGIEYESNSAIAFLKGQ